MVKSASHRFKATLPRHGAVDCKVCPKFSSKHGNGTTFSPTSWHPECVGSFFFFLLNLHRALHILHVSYCWICSRFESKHKFVSICFLQCATHSVVSFHSLVKLLLGAKKPLSSVWVWCSASGCSSVWPYAWWQVLPASPSWCVNVWPEQAQLWCDGLRVYFLVVYVACVSFLTVPESPKGWPASCIIGWRIGWHIRWCMIEYIDIESATLQWCIVIIKIYI